MLRDEKALEELKEIIRRDYGADISDDQAQELGTSLLRLTRVAIAVLARKEAVEQQLTANKQEINNDKTH